MSTLSPAGAGIQYRNRQTGTIVTEPIGSERLLRWFYEHRAGFKVFDYCLNSPALCRFIGAWMNHPASRRYIAAFVSQYQIDAHEAEFPPDRYPSFNAFFARRLKAGARPFTPAPGRLCAPADGKVLVYPKLQDHSRMPVKGAAITPRALLASEPAAVPYDGGSALIVRLAPYDYHRFHFPDDGTAGPARPIKGRYHSVSPIALARVPALLSGNTRAVTEVISRHFGRIAYVEIGAFAVGSIVQTYRSGQVVRGQEKGYFQFGGSTVVLLFEPGAIVFDDDLVRDSGANLEVQVQAGSPIGSSGMC